MSVAAARRIADKYSRRGGGILSPFPQSRAMSAAQALALKLRAAPAPGPGRPRGCRTTVRAAGAAHVGALQHRRYVSLAQGGRFLRGAPLPAAQQRPRPLPWAERAARRHDGGGVVASAPAAAGVRSMSRIPQGNTGLYDPSMDRDSCGVGFIAELSAEPSRKTVSAFATSRALLGVHSSLLKLSVAQSFVPVSMSQFVYRGPCLNCRSSTPSRCWRECPTVAPVAARRTPAMVRASLLRCRMPFSERQA